MNNVERAQQLIAKWIDDNLPYSEENDWADEAIAEALADAGLLAGEYVELAPENRLGVGASKTHVIISDNKARTTIKITHDLASDLITALLMVKSSLEGE